jgi:Cof subfamily protein (haloacid dehalogenase superfamily)
MFTYATARSYNSAYPLTEKLNISLPVIIYNGGFIYDSQKNEFIHKNLFTKDEISSITAITKASGLTPLVYTLVNGEQKILWNNNADLSDGFRHYLSTRADDKRLTPVDSLDSSFSGDIFYMTFIESYDDLYPVYNTVKNENKFNLVFQQEIYREEYWCEIMPKTASKANAATLLKSKLCCDELVVFGDSLNDIPMFEVADRAYAVKNANDSLKQIATEIIGYNYENSVALKLCELEKEKLNGFAL